METWCKLCEQWVSRVTHHIRVSLLCIELGEIVLVCVHTGEAVQIDRGFVVSEQKTSRVGLVNVVVEISTTSDWHRIPVKTEKVLKLVRLNNACMCVDTSTGPDVAEGYECVVECVVAVDLFG